MTDFVDAF